MREFTTEAWALEKIPTGDADARVALFTRASGRVAARATSIRRITSKLAAHLEPFAATRVRLVEGRGGNGSGLRLQVADALIDPARAPLKPEIATLILHLTPEGEADPALWELLVRGRLPAGRQAGVREALAILGYDATHAVCEECGATGPRHFFPAQAAYWCGACLTPAADRRAYVTLR